MVLSILPAGSGNRDVNVLLRSHALGLLLGAFATFAALTLAGAAIRAAMPDGGSLLLVATGVAATAWLPRSLGARIGPRWPARYWQVPQEWRFTMPLPATMAAYGFLLGLGVLTTPVLPVMWVFVGATIATGAVSFAALGWVSYAASRWLMTLRETRRSLAAGEVPDEVHGARGYHVARVLNVGVLGLAAACAALQLPTLT